MFSILIPAMINNNPDAKPKRKNENIRKSLKNDKAAVLLLSSFRIVLQLTQISASGKTADPQRGQNLLPPGGLTPHDIQISVSEDNFFPQLLQQIFDSVGLVSGVPHFGQTSTQFCNSKPQLGHTFSALTVYLIFDLSIFEIVIIITSSGDYVNIFIQLNIH